MGIKTRNTSHKGTYQTYEGRRLKLNSEDPIFWKENPDTWDEVVLAGEYIPGVCRVSGNGMQLRKQELVTAGSNGAAVTILGLQNVQFTINVTMWLPEHLRAFRRIIEAANPSVYMKRSNKDFFTINGQAVQSYGYLDAGIYGEYSSDEASIGDLSDQSVTNVSTDGLKNADGSSMDGYRDDKVLQVSIKQSGSLSAEELAVQRGDRKLSENDAFAALGPQQSWKSVVRKEQTESYDVGMGIRPVQVYHPSLALFGIRLCTLDSISLPTETSPGVWQATITCTEYGKPEFKGLSKENVENKATIEQRELTEKVSVAAFGYFNSNRPSAKNTEPPKKPEE